MAPSEPKPSNDSCTPPTTNSPVAQQYTCLFPGVSYRDRVLEDPAGKGVESVRPIRGEIKARVEAKLTPLQRDTASVVGGAGVRGVVWVEPRYVGEVRGA